MYCWVRDCYVDQEDCCILCNNYEQKEDKCKLEEKKK